MTIIADLKGFTLAHKIFVLDENNVKNISQSSIKNMPEVICELARQYNCNKVVLSGSKKYTTDLDTKIKNTFVAKYNCECPLEIEY